MIYYRICPHCQSLCKRQGEDLGIYSGSCNHDVPGFTYNYIQCDNTVIIDIATEDHYVMIQLDDRSMRTGKTFIKLKSSPKELVLQGIVPFDWNNFEFDTFINKLNKIIEMKTFT